MSTNRSVVKSWVGTLPLMMQAVLLSSLRGCDGTVKEDPSKDIVRGIRGLVLESAREVVGRNAFMNAFMKDYTRKDFQKFFQGNLDAYPVHFLLHLTHAVEIIGYKHPDEKVRSLYYLLYANLTRDFFHMNIETESELDLRLCL